MDSVRKDLPETVGADTAPADGNPAAAMPVYKEFTRDQVDAAASDPRVGDAIRKFTGYPVPQSMWRRDYGFIMEIKRLVDKLGVEGAVAVARKEMPRQTKVQIRALVMDLIKRNKNNGQHR